jgi:hypothetical protein
MAVGRYFFRAIERDDGTWACRRGRLELDKHGQLEEALAHLTSLADNARPTEIYVHHRDRRTSRTAIVE